MRKATWIVAMGLLALGPVAAGESPAHRIADSTGVRAGVCVVLGAGDPAGAAELASTFRGLIRVLDPDAGKVSRAREALIKQGVYGERLSAVRCPADRLGLADNFVNLIVVADPAGGWSAGEIVRVLAPGGAAWIPAGGEALVKALSTDKAVRVEQAGQAFKAVKGRPAGMDEWSHMKHDAGGNPVSADESAGPPWRLQWVNDPARCVMSHYFGRGVSAGGRVFWCDYVWEKPNRALKEGKKIDHQVVYALDAFNGWRLWERRNPQPSFTPDDSRDIIVAGEGVLYNIGTGAGCQVLDAASGEIRATFKPEGRWAYVALAEGRLFGWTAGEGLFALEAAAGRPLWKHKPFSPPICIGEGKVFLRHPDKSLVALDAATGKEVWKNSEPDIVGAKYFSGICHGGRLGLRLYIYETLILSAADGKRLGALAAGAPATEKGPTPGGVYMFMGGGIVQGLGGKAGQGLLIHDPATGAIRQRLVGRFGGNCTRITGVRDWWLSGGLMAMNTTTAENLAYGVSRSNCQMGTIVANGLTYTLPNDCVCRYAIKGIVAMAPAGAWRPGGAGDDLATRFEKGPGYGAAPNPQSAIRNPPFGVAQGRQSDWPAFRHDAARTAWTPAAVQPPAAVLWQAGLLGRPTAPVIAGGLAVVGTDAHLVYALDAATGEPRWTHPADGAVLFAPAIWGNLVLFGDQAGWVTCLELATGRVVWRFRAAPERRDILCFNGLSSAWPVSTGVLVDAGVAYFAAGRAAYDGACLYALEPATGKLLWQNRSLGMQSAKPALPIPAKEKDPAVRTTADRSLYGISPWGALAATDRLLLLPNGISLPAYVDRADGKVALWGASFGGGQRLTVAGNWLIVSMDPYGRTLADKWGRAGEYCAYPVEGAKRIGGGKKGHAGIFEVKTDLKLEPVANCGGHGIATWPAFAHAGPVVAAGTGEVYGAIWREDATDLTASTVAGEAKATFTVRWVVRVPQITRAALAAGGTLFWAGDRLPAGHAAGGTLIALDRADGRKLGELPFPGSPVPDGLAAAGGNLYLVTEEGRLLCCGNR